MKLWIQMLWAAMQATGKGYRRHSLRHTGRGLDRRNDKLGEAIGNDGKVVFVEINEGKLQRRARQRTLGVRA